ncbi:CDP-diacylglycerol-inositol 3-phosphatidyltransferase [Apiotrichum porosum]|uniref:CDP-diacylglycerol--inositol 3-phosphatidyltransferase n=1 Tax=Apiotrichum porosum TaxID=105984 RepID=A0A427Y220_9TREE|nr:CDP-diacylglycerol-inositol 3-phosphatidyltransferase [Apiotrichum porosum]RSH85073.1 CDP-diacylglycerol-inositol 3-phosphatidyltransferase [Apiotrichum porosum]
MPPTTRSKQGSPAPAALATARETDINTTIRQRPREGSRSRNPDDVYDAKYAVDLATYTVDENVFLFVPNLIGYVRVILAAAALYYMPNYPRTCTVLYGVSCLLDALDGLAARALNQSSKFGAVLDMVTDRCTTACLLCYLASAYPKYALLYQFLIALDFASHYIHMYSSNVTGSSSHKNITADVSRILYYYYTSKFTLFMFCFCNELFFVCMYLNAFIQTPISSVVLPELVVKTGLDKIAPCLLRGAANLTWPQFVAALNFPLCAGKQIINVVQFWKASKILVGIDLVDRQKARAKKAAEEAFKASKGAAVL